MPNANRTVHARASLRDAIRRLYKRAIRADDWSTVSPSAAPPGGLGSYDRQDWWLTLDLAAKIMRRRGYTVASISTSEAETERSAKLEASVVLLAEKSSGRPTYRGLGREQGRNLRLAIGVAAVVTGFLIVRRHLGKNRGER